MFCVRGAIPQDTDRGSEELWPWRLILAYILDKPASQNRASVSRSVLALWLSIKSGSVAEADFATNCKQFRLKAPVGGRRVNTPMSGDMGFGTLVQTRSIFWVDYRARRIPQEKGLFRRR
jgi:hypothetical protein